MHILQGTIIFGFFKKLICVSLLIDILKFYSRTNYVILNALILLGYILNVNIKFTDLKKYI